MGQRQEVAITGTLRRPGARGYANRRTAICTAAVKLTLLFLVTGAVAPGLVGTAEASSASQATSAQDRFGPLRLLEGSWEGAIDGRLGTGVGVRDYEFILDDHFLLLRQDSVRLPQDRSPEGDHHRELAVFSYDTERETVVLREFFVEGVVNRYTCELDAQRVVCVTEAVESGPGIRARLTLEIPHAYEFEETFEIAFSEDAELAVYFTNHWTRTPKLQ